MPNLLTCTVLFLSSYSPLFGILALRSFSEDKNVAAFLAVLAAISLIFLAVYLSQAKTLNPMTITASRVNTRDGEAISYIVTYLLPFLDIDFKDCRNLISLSIVFLVLGILYVNSSLVYANPVLNLVGYHVLEVETMQERTFAVICKRSYIPAGTQLHVVSLSNFIMLEVSNAQ